MIYEIPLGNPRVNGKLLAQELRTLPNITGYNRTDQYYAISLVEPDAALLAQIQAIVAAHNPDALTAEEQETAAQAQVLETVKMLLQSAAGVAIQDLTQAQMKALLAALLWREGAIDNSGQIRAYGEWRAYLP